MAEDRGGKDNVFFTINEKGELVRPSAYRHWIYVGTPVTPNDLNGGKAAFPEFHNVYIDPVSYEHWKEVGTWRDGTIIIKELVSVGKKSAVSGKGYFMGDFIGLEATIKSTKHFPDEPGNWAYFSFTNPDGPELKATGKPFETQSCNECHDQSARDDFVFTQYYPVLRAAKGFGKGAPEAVSTRGSQAAGVAPKTAAPVVNTDDKWQPTAETPASVDSEIPVNLEDLYSFLQSVEYRDFETQESAVHPSEGPHTRRDLPVRVFMNDKVASSLRAGNREHPIGSGIVKEMFSEEGELSGWAVSVKTQDQSDRGKGWFWYEVTSTTDPTQIVAAGNGVRGCYGCHDNGHDMVLSEFPLR